MLKSKTEEQKARHREKNRLWMRRKREKERLMRLGRNIPKNFDSLDIVATPSIDIRAKDRCVSCGNTIDKLDYKDNGNYCRKCIVKTVVPPRHARN